MYEGSFPVTESNVIVLVLPEEHSFTTSDLFFDYAEAEY